MPEWIRVYDPRNLSYYYFNNMNKAIVHDGERDARGKWLAPRHFEDSWRIGDEMIHPEILGAFKIQSMLSAFTTCVAAIVSTISLSGRIFFADKIKS